MTFVAKPMFPGDLHEVAGRLARDAGEALVKAHDAPSAAALYARVWKQAAELGWCGVLIPEEHGGAGGTLADVAALAEAVSRHALVLPVAAACAVAPTLLTAANAYGGATALLPHVLSGSCRLAPVLPVGNEQRSGLVVEQDGDDYRFGGTAQAVEMTGDPTHFAIACSITRRGGGDEPALFIIAGDAQGLSKTRYQGMDGRHTADLAFNGCRVAESGLLARGSAVAAAVERARLAGAAIVCAETVAAIGGLLEESIPYLHTRVQFGSPLAKLDVLRHKVAEIYVGYETLKALVTSLAREAAAGGPGWPRKVSLAKLYAAEFGRFAAHAGIQLHGAMGMTEELLAARLARRILMAEFDYGSRAEHFSRLAAMQRLGNT